MVSIAQCQEQYVAEGFTVLRSVIPVTLIHDLRHQADIARRIARSLHGPRVQRLEPIYAYEDLDHHLFDEVLNLPDLVDAVAALLGDGHGTQRLMAMLFEPQDKPWCTNWHRDWRDHVPGLSLDRYHEAAQNLRMFNQFNAPLYDDNSLFVVPFSHNRPSTSAEATAFPDIPARGPPLTEDQTPVEREFACREYVAAMPGSVGVPLRAGDIAFYRASLWHLGAYVPHVRRATLHDGFFGAEDISWQQEMIPLVSTDAYLRRLRGQDDAY